MEALKRDTYAKEHLINQSLHFEIPDSIVINLGPYFISFIDENEIIRGAIF